jgi:hypothetical protein
MCPLQIQITLPNNRPEIVMDNICNHTVRGRQSTNLDGSRSLLTLGDNMKKFPELIHGRRQNNVIKRTSRYLEHRHPDDLADDLRINHDNMPCKGGLKNNAIIIILHNLEIGIELPDQPREPNAGVVVEVSPVIGLDDLMNTIQLSNHNISTNDIPLWNDYHVHNSGFKAATSSSIGLYAVDCQQT